VLIRLMKVEHLVYNKDNQEDKDGLFDAADTVRDTLQIFVDMVAGISVNKAAMRSAAAEGFATATDLADYLVKQGVPFRDAHETVASVVKHCVDEQCDIADLSLEILQSYHSVIKEDVFDVLTLEGSVAARNHIGGTSPERVHEAAQALIKSLQKDLDN